jgi:hypothetical protein
MKTLITAIALGMLMSVEPAESEPQYDREWCQTEAATDSEMEYCDAMFPDLYETEEEWEAEFAKDVANDEDAR